jgi:HEAT repeat protein
MAKSNASPELLSLAQRLQDPEIRRRDVSGWPGDLLGLLGEIESAGEVDVFPQILALILDEDQAVAAMASRAIGGVLARLAPAEVAKLDSIVRDRGIYLPWDQHGWYRLSHEVLDRHLDSGGFPPAFAGLASLHNSGYVRQAAVRRLAEGRDGFEVPYLLLRVNDWVSPVRKAARAALWERLRPEHARHLVRNLSLVTRLTRCGRDDHSPFVAAVFDLLRAPDSRSALLEGLSSTDREVRRACFDLAMETTEIPLLDLLDRLLQHDEPILRLRAVQVARARLDSRDYLNLVGAIRADRFMPVRRETLSSV